MEIIVSALLKLIFVLKLNPQRIREHHLVGRNGSMVPTGWKAETSSWDHAVFKQKEITSWKIFQVLFYLLQLCLEQFSHALPSAGCYRPSKERWNGSCSAPALHQPRVRWLGLSCCWRWFAGSQQQKRKWSYCFTTSAMSSAWEGHIFSCHSCCVGKAMFVGRINSVIDRPLWLEQHYLWFSDLLHSSVIPSFSLV